MQRASTSWCLPAQYTAAVTALRLSVSHLAAQEHSLQVDCYDSIKIIFCHFQERGCSVGMFQHSASPSHPRAGRVRTWHERGRRPPVLPEPGRRWGAAEVAAVAAALAVRQSQRRSQYPCTEAAASCRSCCSRWREAGDDCWRGTRGCGAYTRQHASYHDATGDTASGWWRDVTAHTCKHVLVS